jgi:hypothetical protein
MIVRTSKKLLGILTQPGGKKEGKSGAFFDCPKQRLGLLF